MKLKINFWTGIFDITNTIVFLSSWFVIILVTLFNVSNGNGFNIGIQNFFHTIDNIMAGIGIILNVIAFIQSRKYGISIIGSMLGIIGNIFFFFSGIFALPVIILLLTGAVFNFLQHPVKNNTGSSK